MNKINLKDLNVDQAVLMGAGILILLTLFLAMISTSLWLILTALIGVNLIQAPITGFCPMAMLLKKFGYKPGTAFN